MVLGSILISGSQSYIIVVFPLPSNDFSGVHYHRQPGPSRRLRPQSSGDSAQWPSDCSDGGAAAAGEGETKEVHSEDAYWHLFIAPL